MRRWWTPLAVRLAVPAFLGNLLILLSLIRHRRAILPLAAAPAPPHDTLAHWPTVTAIVPARDEAAGLRPAVASLLRQDYPDLRLVLVDDRSTDGTGCIMAELARAHPDRVQVLRVDRLPPGWLGKTHALWLGAGVATGDWLLFTDADALFAPGCLRRAVAHAEAHRLDHLTLFCTVVARGYWLDAFMSTYQYALLASQLPYRAANPRSPAGLGLGGFNLIRRPAYERIGTFAAVALRPDEDVRFGRRVKRCGLRQGVLSGAGLLWQEWYPSLGGAIAGLEKGLFAGLDYSVPQVAVAVGWLGALIVSPPLLAWGAPPEARRWLLTAAGIHALNVVLANRQLGRRAGHVVPALPVAGALLCWAFTRSCARALLVGGVRWRGTLYPLAELRGQTGLEGLPRWRGPA